MKSLRLSIVVLTKLI